MLLALAPAAFAAPVPTTATRLDVEVSAGLAELTVTRTFRHDGATPVDTELWAALPPGGTVDKVVVDVGDRHVESRVVGREAARTTYVSAANSGRVATLLESAGGDTVVQRIANVLPGEVVRIELHVVQLVDRHDGLWELVVPLVVAPSLQDPGGEGPTYLVPTGPDADPRSVPIVERVDAHVAVHAGRQVSWIESPSHPSVGRTSGAEATLDVAGAPANRDLVVRWSTAVQDPTPTLWVAGDLAVLQLEAPAPWARASPPPGDVVVLVDASDTMIGRWPRVVDVVLEVLAGLRPDDRFTVLAVADVVQGAAVREPGSPEAITAALDRLDRLSLGGGTNLALGLKFANGVPVPDGRPKTVVVVSDGGTDQRVTGLVAPGTRVHTIGVGAATNAYLLGQLATGGGGISVTVRPEDDVVGAVRPIVDALPGPLLTDVALWWTPRDVFPAKVPPLYADRAVDVVARGVGCEPVTVTGLYCGRPFSVVAEPRCRAHDRGVEVVFARRLVDALGVQSWPAAEAAAIEFQIASPYTSFVGVDSEVHNAGGYVGNTVVVANQPVDVVRSVHRMAGSTQAMEVAVTARERPVDVEAPRTEPLSSDLVERLPASPGLATATTGAPSPSAFGRTSVVAGGLDATDLAGGRVTAAYDARIGLAGVPARLPGPVIEAEPRRGTNNLDGRVFVGANPPLSGEDEPPGGFVDAGISGPIVRDRAWVTFDADADHHEVAHVDVDGVTVDGSLMTQPNPQHRVQVRASTDERVLGVDGAEIPIGGSAGMGQYTYWASPTAHTTAVAGADRQLLGDAHRDRYQAVATLGAVSLRDPLDGANDVELGASATALGWNAAQAAIGAAWLQDERRNDGVTVAAGVRADLADRVWASPRLYVAWDPLGDQKTRLAAGVARYVDTARYVPDAFADPAAPVRDEVHVDLQREIVEDFAIRVLGVGTRERFAFLSGPALVTLPAAAVPTVARDVGAFEVQLRKIHTRRWELAAGWRRWFAPPADPALAFLADAPLVAGYLDPYRRDVLSASVYWDLPTDPFTQRIGGIARWAGPVRGVTPARWWLEPSTVLGAILEQDIDVRKGSLALSASLVWAVNDLGSTLLPPEAWAILGDRVGPPVEEPLRLETRVGWRF